MSIEKRDFALKEFERRYDHMLAALKAMSEAYYDQPIGAWFGVIRKAIATAEGTYTPHSR